MKTVVFFTDRAMLPGLHVSLLSLLDKLADDDEFELVVFTDRVSAADIDNLRRTHAVQPRNTKLTCIDYVPKSPQGANPLHRNRGTYGRIYLAELLPHVDRCVYLDCDLVVCGPAGELFAFFDGQHTIYVARQSLRGNSLDRELFIQARLEMDGPCFNPGVMALDLRLWRERDRDADCQTVARKFSGMFRSADQALLNVVFSDDFVAIGDEFNTPLYPTSPRLQTIENRIYHFVGSPKPWDIFGSRLHRNYDLWRRIYDRTAIGKSSPWRYASLKRTLLISRSMMKAWGSGG